MKPAPLLPGARNYMLSYVTYMIYIFFRMLPSVWSHLTVSGSQSTHFGWIYCFHNRYLLSPQCCLSASLLWKWAWDETYLGDSLLTVCVSGDILSCMIVCWQSVCWHFVFWLLTVKSTWVLTFCALSGVNTWHAVLLLTCWALIVCTCNTEFLPIFCELLSI